MESLKSHGSSAYHEEASSLIAGGVNSNVRLSGSTAPPLCFDRARGSRLTDIDGNEYIDYALGMGPAILGHAPATVLAAVERSLGEGQLYAGQSRMELKLARRLCRHVPGAELVRFGMTGSEMVQAAIRVARAATGRPRFVKFSGHYHGWFDNVLTQTRTFPRAPPALGSHSQPLTRGQSLNALADTEVLPWNDLPTLQTYLESHGGQTAAIIAELAMCNTGVIPPAPGYLEGVRRLCDEYGVVLVADEVVTGFRLGLSGAQGLFGITADLSVFAKALGGGVPIAALTGRRSLMSLIGSGSVNHSGTYNANTIGLAAAVATLDLLTLDDAAAYGRIRSAGEALMAGIRELSDKSGGAVLVQGYPSVFNTCFTKDRAISSAEDYQRCDQPRQGRFLQALLSHGVRPTSRGTWFVSAAHTQSDVESTLAAVRVSLRESE